MNEMKKTNLTRGEILMGIELGHFKQGDQFIERDNGKIVTVLSNGSMKYNDFQADVAFKVVPGEVWDIYLGIEVGDWIAQYIGENTVRVSKVRAGYIINDEPLIEVEYANVTSRLKLTEIRKATPEEIRIAKRSEAFESKGRLVNEYKIGDVLPREADDENYLKVLGVDNHGVLLSGGSFRGWVDVDSASVPVFFVEDMVREDDEK